MDFTVQVANRFSTASHTGVPWTTSRFKILSTVVPVRADMQYFTAVFLLMASITLSAAFPHPREAPSPTEDPLRMPLHTTALLAGAAWDLTHSATATRAQPVTPAPPNPTGTMNEQYEL